MDFPYVASIFLTYRSPVDLISQQLSYSDISPKFLFCLLPHGSLEMQCLDANRWKVTMRTKAKPPQQARNCTCVSIRLSKAQSELWTAQPKHGAPRNQSFTFAVGLTVTSTVVVLSHAQFMGLMIFPGQNATIPWRIASRKNWPSYWNSYFSQLLRHLKETLTINNLPIKIGNASLTNICKLWRALSLLLLKLGLDLLTF
jgi:hypothetical protein